MEKKRSVGVTVFGIITSILGLLFFFYSSLMFLILRMVSPPRYTFFLAFGLYTILSHNEYVILAGLSNLIGLIYLIAGIYILKLKNWSRLLIIFCSSVIIVFLILLVSSRVFPHMTIRSARLVLIPNFLLPIFFSNILYSTILIYFFTRPKVKRQFIGAKFRIEKKRSVGVIAFGTLLIVFPISNFLINTFYYQYTLQPLQYFFILSSIIIGIGILLLKKWARKSLIIFAILAIFVSLVSFFIIPEVIFKNNFNLIINIWMLIYNSLLLFFFHPPQSKGAV